MEREKFDILNISLNKILFGFFIGLASFTVNFTFSQNSFAEYKATLSASVNETTASINGTEIIESSDEIAEHNINLKINTTNKTGYTATFNSKTDETALLNTDSAINTKIDSISSNSSLINFPANTWGYRFDDDAIFSPIPSQSASVNLIKTTKKSTSEENHKIKLGMKLNSSLKPGNYENKLIISVVSNPYTPKAVMTEGEDFNNKLKSLLENETAEMKHFRRSLTTPVSTINTKNIEDEDSDYEIKLWTDPATESVYYYVEPEKVYLNTDSNSMFYSGYNDRKIDKILEIDFSSLDTSQVTNMSHMFSGMSNLTTLDLSNFDTSKVTNMKGMFLAMSNLITLDLSNFNTSQVTDMSFMFFLRDHNKLKDKLEKIYVNNDFDTANLTNISEMFGNRKKLRGGNGSYLLDPLTADKSWLRIDRPGVQGYFTRKS